MNKYLYFLFLIVFSLIGIYYYTENTSNKINFLDNNKLSLIKDDLIKYLDKVSNQEIYFKTNKKSLKKTDLYQYYTDNILNFTESEKIAITKCVKYIKKEGNKYDFLTNLSWNFVKLSNKIEKGMPFTLGKHIYFSTKFLDEIVKITEYNDNKNFIEFCDTLIHEKIHIIQRTNEELFYNFYKNDLNYINTNKINISKFWKRLNLKNPDGIDINWIIKYNNKYYLPMLIFIDDSLEQIIIELKYNNKYYYTTKKYMNIKEFIPFKDYPNNISTYHPNEITAYILPKIILKKQAFKKIIQLKFNKLLNKINH